MGGPVRCRLALKVHKGGLSRSLLEEVQLHSGRNLVLESCSTTAGARVEDLPSVQRACLPPQSNLQLDSHNDFSPFTSFQRNINLASILTRSICATKLVPRV